MDWASIDFDPKTRQGRGVGEIPHRVVYLCPKYVHAETPSPLREWLQAIDDTLDSQVEESAYQHPLIQRIFDHIEQDQVSPEERFRMIEEYNQEQLRRAVAEEAKAEGELAAKITIARSLLAEGTSRRLIAKVTGLDDETLSTLTKADEES